ncbi:hypothetical protein [Neorhizobium sp. P12A]|uniref:hypothetical protein n=1 Tax=Neorhizobium sp. P12A TaxID=2268027 RepID=UPI00165EA2F7|nr:hypothetical protein [Neorhizobium sp. P12A]
MKALIVTAPFGKYAKGEQITDAAEIETVLEVNPNEVVTVNLPDEPQKPGKDAGSPANT